LEPSSQRLADLNARQRATLGAIVLAGLLLRLAFHHGRPFDGDELGTLIYLKKSIGYLLTNFFEPWMSMSWYLALLKTWTFFAGGSDLALRAPTLVADTCSIALVAALAIRFVDARVALLAAALYAFNPYLVLFAGTIRAYALLVVAALALLVATADWCARPTFRRGCAVSTAALLMILMQPVGCWVALFAALAAGARLLRTARITPGALRTETMTIVLPGVCALALAIAAYLPTASMISAYAAIYRYHPPTPVDYLAHTLTDYFAPGAYVIPSLFFLAAGWIEAARRRPGLLVLSGVIPLHMLAMSLSGISYWPWAMSRMLLAVVPILLILIALGVSWAGPTPIRSLLLAIFLAVSWLPGLATLHEKRERYPVNDLVAHLQASLEADDALVALDSWALLRLLEPFEGRWQRAHDYAAWLDQDPGRRMVVVSSGEPIMTGARLARFGDFQVTAYTEPERRMRLEHLYRDLRHTGDGRTASGLAEYYEVLLQLQPIVAPQDDAAELTRLYYESLRRTRRSRFNLPQFLDIPYEERR
jgi:hypothetical protein